MNEVQSAESGGVVEALAELLRQYTAGAWMTLNENRDAMMTAGRVPGASGGDVIRAGLGDWPESFLGTRSDLVRGVVEAIDRSDSPPSRCWCGSERGPRTPSDDDGLGCLGNVTHTAAPVPSERNQSTDSEASR